MRQPDGERETQVGLCTHAFTTLVPQSLPFDSVARCGAWAHGTDHPIRSAYYVRLSFADSEKDLLGCELGPDPVQLPPTGPSAQRPKICPRDPRGDPWTFLWSRHVSWSGIENDLEVQGKQGDDETYGDNGAGYRAQK